MNPEILILHLEDSPADAELIRERMVEEGLNVRVDVAANEQDFVTFLQNGNYDLILTDHHVPGFECTASFQRVTTLRPGTPCICVSGAIGEDSAVELLRQGATDYVSKDRLDRLPWVVRRALAEAHERKMHQQADGALRKSKQQYDNLISKIPVGIYLLQSTPEGISTLSYVSPRMAKIFNASAESILADNRLVFQAIYPAELAAFVQSNKERLQKGEPFDWEGRIVIEGKIKWLHINSTPDLLENGDILWHGVVADITERKRAEMESLRDKAELAAIYDYTPFIMCLLDEERRVLRVNRIGLQESSRDAYVVLGFRSGELLGCINSQDDPCGCGHGPECGKCLMLKVIQDTTLTGREHRGVEVRLPLARGREARHLSFIIHTARLIVTGQPRVLLCVEDVTDRKHLEDRLRQAQKLESIGQLAGGVAHDFNNIIASTMMHLSLLRTNPNLDEETQNSLKELEVETIRAANLTRQLLAFGRRSVLDIKVQDMNEIIANLLKMLRRLIGEQINLQFNGKGRLPNVAADAGMMEQVIMNLAVNARDAMPNGGQITITTQTVEVTADEIMKHPDRKPGQFVCLSVADQGCGMDTETLKQIFEPFFTTKEVGKGTGLGLATVHGIVAQHQGWVEVESVVDQGSTFRIYIPATQTVTSDGEASNTILPMAGGNETILMVEDDQTLRRVISLRLRKFGYQVLEACNGPEALTQWETISQQVDIVLTDMVMPGGISGLDLVENLRKTKPTLKAIVSSGYSSILTHSDTPGKNGVVFLPKPYDSAALAKTVRDYLDRR